MMNNKKSRQNKGLQKENFFIDYCNNRNIDVIKLDKATDEFKSNFLIDVKGSCPDFICKINLQNIFVEIKTHTIITNEANQQKLESIIKYNKEVLRNSSPVFWGPRDFKSELKDVFEGYLRKASKKFKNLKLNNNYPRILIIYSDFAIDIDYIAIFKALYPTLNTKNTNVFYGNSNNERGLFDSTGSNVSAIVYFDNLEKKYRGIQNHNSPFLLDEDNFNIFFN